MQSRTSMLADDLRELPRRFGRVGRAIATAPGRWRLCEWGVFVTVVAAASAAYAEKWPIQLFCEQAVGAVPRAMALFIDTWGGGLGLVILGVTAFLVGKWRRRASLVDAALVLAVAGIWCWLFTKAGQLIFAERRPSAGGAMVLFALGGHGVSGHASGAGLVFGTVRGVLARDASPTVRYAVTAALVAWAALVGWSRVWLGMHFVWNVILGLAVGLFTGFLGARYGRSGGSAPSNRSSAPSATT
jgi:membrane-associated phospholipid phosphatase